MGTICWGHNYPYFAAVRSALEEHGIPVLVQDLPNPHLWGRSGQSLTVPDAEHDRALRLLKDADLDPAQTDLGSAG